jgi:hypothetical protein
MAASRRPTSDRCSLVRRGIVTSITNNSAVYPILSKASKPGGRPHAVIDPIQLEGICALQCTDEEVAAFFRVTQKTIQRRKQNPKRLQLTDDKGETFTGTFAEIMERGKARGRVSVRRALFSIAASGKHGCAAAAIFLSKNLLGYRDVQEVTGPNGGALVVEKNPLSDIPTDKLMQAIALLSAPAKPTNETP